MSFICKVNGCRRTLPFPTLAYLKRHQRDVHEVKRVVCEACGWRFSRQQHLRDHLTSTHPSRGCPGRRTMSTSKEAANAPKGDVRRQPNGAAPSVPAQVSEHLSRSSSASPAEIELGAAAGKASANPIPVIRQTQRRRGQGRHQPYTFPGSKEGQLVLWLAEKTRQLAAAQKEIARLKEQLQGKKDWNAGGARQPPQLCNAKAFMVTPPSAPTSPSTTAPEALTHAATTTVSGSNKTTPAQVTTAAQPDTSTGVNGATFSSGPSAAAIIMPTLDMELNTTSTEEAPVTISDEPAHTPTSSGVTGAGTTAMDVTLPLLTVSDLDELLKQW